jgi:hypothetical protein
MPAHDYCGDPSVKGQTGVITVSNNPVLTGESKITSLTQAPIYIWGGLKDVGDVSWHKVNMYTVADSSGSRRPETFSMRFYNSGGASNSKYDMAVFTPQSNTGGGAGGGVGCPGTGSTQNNVFGNDFLNSTSDKEELCTRHTGAQWNPGGFETNPAVNDLWQFGDNAVNAGYAGGGGHNNSRFTSSNRNFHYMSSSSAVSHPYPGTYTGNHHETYVMVRVIKISSSGTCHPYQIRADADTPAPYEGSGCAFELEGVCFKDDGGLCDGDEGAIQCDFSCLEIAPFATSLFDLMAVHGICQY